MTLRGLLRHISAIWIRDFTPGDFAFVMATGIASLGAFSFDMPLIAKMLFQLNKMSYIILSCLTLVRLLQYPSYVWRDFTSASRGPGFLAIVAGTCVVGSQYVIIEGDLYSGAVLWAVSGVLWLIIMYSFFSAVITSYPKESLEEEIHGGWLLAVVSTQAISILGVLVAPYYGNSQGTVLFVSAIMYFLGCMLYLVIISLIFWRLVLYVVTAQSLTSPYWIAMGSRSSPKSHQFGVSSNTVFSNLFFAVSSLL